MLINSWKCHGLLCAHIKTIVKYYLLDMLYTKQLTIKLEEQDF